MAYRDLKANVFGDEPVWTSTFENGETASGFALGDPNTSDLIGTPAATDDEWISNSVNPFTRSNPLFGISAVLTVSAVPEPSSIVIWLSAAGWGAVGAYARRRWQNRRVR
jgi:hypothetical protein